MKYTTLPADFPDKSNLGEKYKIVVDEITREFEALGKLTDAAFDTANNLKTLNMSVSLAMAYNVDEKSILKSIIDVDSFMLQ